LVKKARSCAGGAFAASRKHHLERMSRFQSETTVFVDLGVVITSIGVGDRISIAAFQPHLVGSAAAAIYRWRERHNEKR
jgi:hypothetical protein